MERNETTSETLAETLSLVLQGDIEIGEGFNTEMAEEDAAGCPDIARVCSFSEYGLMTDDSGIVITLADGTEFEVSIKQRF